MLVHKDTTRQGGQHFAPNLTAFRGSQLRSVVGDHWSYRTGPGGSADYATNGATQADRFVFLHCGFSIDVEDMRYLLRVLETDDAGQINSHVVVRTLGTLSVGEAARLAAETIQLEAAGRPVFTIGISAGGAIMRAMGGRYPELPTHQVDFNSVGNAVPFGGQLWREISDAAVALGEGGDISERVASGLDQLRHGSVSANASKLARIFGPPMRELNGVIRSVEFIASSVRGGNVYDTLARGIPRLVQFYGADFVQARCMQRFCSELDVRAEMKTIGDRRRAGLVAPVTLPIRGALDTVCKRRMMYEARDLMASVGSIEMSGLSHEIGTAQPAVRALARMTRDATLELASGRDAYDVYQGIVNGCKTGPTSLREQRQPWLPTVSSAPLGLVRGLAPISTLPV